MESGEFQILLSISIETVPITTDFGVIFSYFFIKKTLILWTVEANQAIDPQTLVDVTHPLHVPIDGATKAGL